MLILTRRCGEACLIGDDVVVCILGVKGNQIRVGISAPSHKKILREELVAAPESPRQPPQVPEQS